MAFAIAHLQRSAHAKLYRRRISRWRGGDLMPVTVKGFHGPTRALGVEVHIWTIPFEIEDASPFERDHEHAA
jgi:hypothetical protein